MTEDKLRIRGVMRRSLNRIRKKFASLRNIEEIKGSTSPPIARDYLLRKLIKENIEIYYIVADKKHIPRDRRTGRAQNRFYNYLMGILVENVVKNNSYDEYNCLIDERSIRVGYLNSFEDYINIKLNYELNFNIQVNVSYGLSHNYFELQAADFICNTFGKVENHPNQYHYWSIFDQTRVTRLIFPIDSFGI